MLLCSATWNTGIFGNISENFCLFNGHGTNFCNLIWNLGLWCLCNILIYDIDELSKAIHSFLLCLSCLFPWSYTVLPLLFSALDSKKSAVTNRRTRKVSPDDV